MHQLTNQELDRIRGTRTAVIDKIYSASDGKKYIGMKGGWLKEMESASKVLYAPKGSDIDSTQSVQDLIDSVDLRRIPVDFGESLFPECVYVTVSDTDASESMIAISNMYITTDRDVDELEFTEFTCSIVNINKGVSYQVLVCDSSRQAEGIYWLNIVKI